MATVVAGVTIASEEFDLGRALSVASAQTELVQFVPVGESLVPYLWVAGGDDEDVDAFERAVRDDRAVEEFVRLDRLNDRRLYRVEWREGLDGFLTAVRGTSVWVERGIGTAAEWTFQLRAPDREGLSAFYDTCRERGVAIDVRRVFENSQGVEVGTYGLTPEQIETLALAFERGYFDVPRRTSQADLAEHLDISRSAVSRRLTRALRTHLANSLLPEFEHESTGDVD